MDGIKLSIVVLVYNLEKYLGRCLDALVGQTLKNIEIICVNDGSPDNSQAVIEQYQTRYPDIVKGYVKENGGEWTARNFGLEHAHGEYVTFVDNDDWMEPDWAQKLYEAAEKYDADLAVCAFDRVDIETGKRISVDMKWNNITQFDIRYGEYRPAFINPAPWNKIYRLSCVRDFRFLSLRGFSDMCFLMSSLLTMKKVVVIPDILYHYSIRSDSQIHNIQPQDVENAKKALCSVRQLYDTHPNGSKMQPTLDLMAFIHLGISIMYRVSYSKDCDLKKTTNDTVSFLDEYFPGWRHSIYLRFSFIWNKGIKLVCLWAVSLLYRSGLQGLFFRCYRFIHDKLKIDIKW